MAAYITVGAKTTHGGEVITGSPYTTHNGVQVSRKGDKVLCKKCNKVTTILTGDPSFIVDGAPIARTGDITSCGAKLIAIQQSFCESDFEVGGVEQPAPLVFPKSDPEAFFASLAPKSDEESHFAIQDVYLNNNLFIPFGIKARKHVPVVGPGSIGKDPDNYDKIFIKVKVKSGSFKDFKLVVVGEQQPLSSKSGTFNEGDIVILEWDGFIGDIYATRALLAGVDLKVYATDLNSDATTSETKKVVFKFKNKDWIDINIDRKSREIVVSIRVSVSELDWKVMGTKVVDSKSLQEDGPLIRQSDISKHLTNSEVESLVKQSMSRYWSRHHNTINSKPLDIDIKGNKYQVFTKCKITDSNSMPKVDVTFNTNREPARSRNWEASRIVYYNVGHLLFENGQGNKKWGYRDKSRANEVFKRVFAHEVGHDLLLGNGGHSYSKTHKGSSHIWQSPNGNHSFTGSEYDLMKYANQNPPDFYDKVVASEDDVRGLLAIAKLTL